MQSGTMLRLAEAVLKVLIVLNLAFGVLTLTVVLGSFAIEQRLLGWLAGRGVADPVTMLTAMRLAGALAIVAVLPTHFVLSRLAAMVKSVRSGAAFAPVNARRLKTIAWALLALQVIDVMLGAIAAPFEESSAWEPSVTGWLAVLLLFVLAQVFEQGAAMREELDATV